jgi:hypothetical protein
MQTLIAQRDRSEGPRRVERDARDISFQLRSSYKGTASNSEDDLSMTDKFLSTLLYEMLCRQKL